ncbi:hypothetical protein [Enhygromyxa salina]|uniref:FG-GAP repeat protein n=1 Tax=Enhygromyxa salina TaxID=215803 RepID=A0A2S9YKF0_9BACT|nr:hypothetical protein [Enhygromyxa salina]PRQ05581.1 FG-GAP repeat protein [Enhygromyxa salina]
MRELGFDPRHWNLFAGVTLVVAGCGGRVGSANDGNADAATVTTNTPSDTSSDAECNTHSDCPAYYQCIDQICHYTGGHQDGWGPYDMYEYDCFNDSECGLLEQCTFNICHTVGVASSCNTDLPLPAPLPIPGQALGLTFADVDGDGVDELVVATSTELHVFENGVDAPTSSVRGDGSDSVDAMVGGQFDVDPGEDVMLSFAGTQSLHHSDGNAGLLPPVTMPSPIGVAAGLLAGDFDEQPPDEVLMWGAGGALVEGAVVPLLLSDSPQVSSAVAGPLGFAVTHTDRSLEFFDLDGLSSWTGSVDGRQPHALVAPIAAMTLSASSVDSHEGPWALFQAWDPSVSDAPITTFGFAGEVSLMRRGDFDGDGVNDIAIIASTGLWLHLTALESIEQCYAKLDTGRSPAVALSVGDHDGDGDDELAVLLADATVLIFDGELP